MSGGKHGIHREGGLADGSYHPLSPSLPAFHALARVGIPRSHPRILMLLSWEGGEGERKRGGKIMIRSLVQVQEEEGD